MADESDGIEEALESTVRLAVMAGARLGSEIARAREEQLRQHQLRDELTARQLAQRFEAEKLLAVAELGQVHRPDWWDRADAERIGQTYATARAWAPEAEEAARAERRMRDELQARYGIDLDRTDPRAVGAEVDGWQRRLEEQRRQEAARERSTGAAEEVEAVVLLGQAAREDQQAEDARADGQRAEAQANQTAAGAGDNPRATGPNPADGQDLLKQAGSDRQRAQDSDARGDHLAARSDRQYDSTGRRAADARALEEQGIEPDVATTRMQADTGAGTPATSATAGAGRGSRAPRARKAVSRGTQIERAGVER